jgi:hypothetical protein
MTVMTDDKYKEASLILATESVRLANALETVLPKILPLTRWDEAQKAFRHSPDAKENPLLFCWMKLAGATATVVPMCSLMAIRSCFAAAILARSVRESILCIQFMYPTSGKSEWLNEKQKIALQNFYTEIWADIQRPFETTKKTAQIPLDDLCASWGRLVSTQPDANPSDMTATARHLMSCYSNYTHMGYPALMELFRVPPLRLSGKEATLAHFDLHGAANVLDGVCQVASAMIGFHSKGLEDFPAEKALRTLCEQQQSAVEEISKRLDAGFSHGDRSKQILRAMKTGKPIDDLLDAPCQPSHEGGKSETFR